MKLGKRIAFGLGIASAAAALMLAPGDAQAVSISVGFAGNEASFRTLTDADPGLGCASAGGEGQMSCVGSGYNIGANWTLDDWSLFVDPDPTINNVFSVTNNTAGTQSFVVTVTLPSAISFGPPSLIRGSIQGGATDNNFNGVTLSNTGSTSIYDGLIDGVSVRTLFDDPTTATGPGSVSLGAASFGIPVQESVFVATTTSIALTLRFDLSAGDSASFTSVFDVQPVPEPGTALLMGLGLAGLAARRRS